MKTKPPVVPVCKVGKINPRQRMTHQDGAASEGVPALPSIRSSTMSAERVSPSAARSISLRAIRSAQDSPWGASRSNSASASARRRSAAATD